MKPFDLEAFKAGAPAINRNGEVVYFGEHTPDYSDVTCRLFVMREPGDENSGYWVTEHGSYYMHREYKDDVIGLAEGEISGGAVVAGPAAGEHLHTAIDQPGLTSFPLHVAEGEDFPELGLGPIDPPVQLTQEYPLGEDYHSAESLADMELSADMVFGYDLARGPDTTAHVLVNVVAEKETEPHGTSAHTPGAKLDAGKLRAGLVLGDFARALAAVAEVGTFGAARYSPGGWLSVPDGASRYHDALMRHWLSHAKGDCVDAGSGLPHLYHMAWNCLALIELLERANDRAGVRGKRTRNVAHGARVRTKGDTT